jgi:hypothetical protein
MLMARQRVWWGLASGAAFASGCAFLTGCATGVDVTDEELAAICAEPNTRCSGGVAGASVGNGGGTGGGFGGSSSGGTFNANGGTGSPSNGGSFSTNGGSGGSIGSSGSGGTGAMLPLAQGDCMPTPDAIVVLYRDRTSGSPSNNEPSMEMQVQNPGGMQFVLSDFAIRYWFTADGKSNFIPTIDYASVNNQGNISSGIEVEFLQEFGSDYAEMTFPTLTDMIGPTGINQLQLRFHADPYSALDQTNDFSFISGAPASTPNRNITPYLRGQGGEFVQIAGCVPIPP